MQTASKTLPTILDAIGGTPLVQLNKVGRETGCRFLVKCEFMNAGGSVKDRIGRRMVLEAEKAGRIKPCGGAIPPRLIEDFEIPLSLETRNSSPPAFTFENATYAARFLPDQA